jgi:hypothetical protein
MHVPKRMRQRPIGTGTRVLAGIGVILGLNVVAYSWLSGPKWGAILGVLFIAIAGYWLFARDKGA